MVSRSRYTAVSAMVVGAALAVVGFVEFLRPGFSPPPMEPFATGAFVVAAGVVLVAAGWLAYDAAVDHLALRLTTLVGLVALALAVFYPASLLFGGVFWLSMVLVGFVAAGAYRTYAVSRRSATPET